MGNVVEKQNVIEVLEEELLINWTLIPSEIEFIYTACKGENNSIICFALQLCSLKNNGRFIDNYKQVEYKIIQHLSKQFGVKYIDRLENEISENSECRYHKKIKEFLNYQGYNNLFSGFADIDNVPKQWDQIVRVIASLKNGIAPAHIIVQKLTNRSSPDNLTKALITMGRIIKTIYIFRYIYDSALRYKVYLQLNRGESRHNLAQHVFFANQGIFKTKEYVQIMNKASCLRILSNLILYWNTIKLHQIIEELKNEGYEIDNNDLAKISPLLFKHILVHGTYSFKRQKHAI